MLRSRPFGAKQVTTMKKNPLHYLALASLAVVLVASLWAQSPTSKPEAGRPEGWQHLALEHDGSSITGDRELARKINEIGREGWELVDVATVLEAGTTTKLIFCFKKPL